MAGLVWSKAVVWFLLSRIQIMVFILISEMVIPRGFPKEVVLGVVFSVFFVKVWNLLLDLRSGLKFLVLVFLSRV